MKKTMSAFAAVTMMFSIQAFAACENGPFMTQAAEQACCPASNAITFAASNPTPNSQGIMTGNNNSVDFVSINTTIPGSNQVLHPQHLDANNIVQGVNYGHPNMNYYGYVSGPAITCFYTYPGFTTTTVYLTMNGIQK